MLRLAFSVFAALLLDSISRLSVAQNLIFREDFEQEHLVKSPASLKNYAVDTYAPNRKFAANLLSNSKIQPYEQYNVYFPCSDTTTKNFYVSIEVFDNEIENLRQFLILDLDSSLESKNRFNISFKAKYNPCSHFSIDSLGLFIFQSENDIKNFFRNGFEENVREINVSVKVLNSAHWEKITVPYLGKGRFLMIGNYMFNNHKRNNGLSCCMQKGKKGDNDFSEIFLDDVIIEY